MAKIDRYQGNLQAFASGATGQERIVFGQPSSAPTQSDDLTENINAAFTRGWGTAPLGDKPPREWFNSAAWVSTQLSAYLHQVGVAEWNDEQEYHTGSIVNVGGKLYASDADDNVNNDPTSVAGWTRPVADAVRIAFDNTGVDTNTSDIQSAVSEVFSRLPWSTPEAFGAVGDGVADDTDAIVAWANSLGGKYSILRSGKSYLCSSLVSGAKSIAFPPNSTVHWNQSEVVFNETLSNNSVAVTLGSNGTHYLPSFRFTDNGGVGHYHQRGMVIESDCKIYGLTYSADTEQPSAAKNDTRDTTVQLRGNNILLDGSVFRNIFATIACDPDVDCTDSIVRSTTFHKYAVGLQTSGRLINGLIDGLSAMSISSYATPTPGQNAITGASDGLTIRNVDISEAAEHAIYLSSPTVRSGVRVSNVVVRSSGQCALKARRVDDLIITNYHGTDQHDGSSPGPNEDGFRFEICNTVKLFNVSTTRGTSSAAGYDGIHIDSCSEVQVNGFTIDGYNLGANGNSCVYITDAITPGSVDNIFINNIQAIGVEVPMLMIVTTGAVGEIAATNVAYRGTSNLLDMTASLNPTFVDIEGYFRSGANPLSNSTDPSSVNLYINN